MKNKVLNSLVCVLTAVILCGMFFIKTDAAPFIDVSSSVSLKIEHIENSTPIVGETFKLYKIADVDRYGNFTPVAEFADAPVDLKADSVQEWKGIAGALESYALLYSIEPFAVAVTDSQGKASFNVGEALKTGLYLIGGTSHVQGKYKYISDPFCVTLPTATEDGSSIIYDVTAKPKFSTKIDNDNPDSYITRKVHKKWDDGNSEKRPESITVYLLRDGVIFDTVELNKDNSWGHTWSQLDSNYRWTVAEKVPDNYEVSITLEGITFLIINKAEVSLPPEETTSSPEDTTSPEDNTTVPDDSTTTPSENTTSAEDDTTLPEDTTDSSESTTSPEEKTTLPEDSTTNPENTTSPEDDTTLPEENTTSPEDKTTVSDDTTGGEDEPDDTTVPDNTPPEEDLPYTGQLWWPVPTCLAVGLAFMVLGALKRRGYEDYE